MQTLLGNPLHPSRPRRWAAATCAALVVVAGAGCGSDSDEPTDAVPTSPATSSESPTSSAATPDNEPPTSEPSPTPSFESRTLTQKGIAVDVPARWRPNPSPRADYVGAYGRDQESFRLARFDVPPQFDAGYSTDRALEVALTSPSIEKKPQRLDDVELLGVEMFHVRGPINQLQTTDYYGGYIGEEEYVEVRLDQPLSRPAGQRDRLAAEIVSTLRTVDGEPLQ